MFIQGQENPNKLYQYDKRAKHQQLAENKAVSFCKIGIRQLDVPFSRIRWRTFLIISIASINIVWLRCTKNRHIIRMTQDRIY